MAASHVSRRAAAPPPPRLLLLGLFVVAWWPLGGLVGGDAGATTPLPATAAAPLRHVYAQYPKEGDGTVTDEDDDAPAHFTHMVVHRGTGRIYAAGTNRLVQLDSKDLHQDVTLHTGPHQDSSQCHASGCNSPDIETQLMDNVNKVLLLDYDHGNLIVCGSIKQGACEKYVVSNLSRTPEFIAKSIAANDEALSTYAFIGPEKYNPWSGASNVMYVGTTFTNNGEYRHDVPAIASRDLYNFDIAEQSFSKKSTLEIDVKYRDHFLVK
jgi:plexin A